MGTTNESRPIRVKENKNETTDVNNLKTEMTRHVAPILATGIVAELTLEYEGVAVARSGAHP